VCNKGANFDGRGDSETSHAEQTAIAAVRKSLPQAHDAKDLCKESAA
jgi:hypothetical protein